MWKEIRAREAKVLMYDGNEYTVKDPVQMTIESGVTFIEGRKERVLVQTQNIQVISFVPEA